MGELKHIGESLYFTPERYKEMKAKQFATIDTRTEYIAGERIYCRACGGEKSVDLPDYNFYTKCECPCQRKKDQAEQRRRERIERAKTYQAINERILPAEVRNASFYGIIDAKSSEHYMNACQRCEKFCNNFQAVKESGRGIWLYGGFDTGKTYLAAAILKRLQSDGVPSLFTSLERIFEELKATYSNSSNVTEQGVMESYVNVECLILDGFTGIKISKRGVENWAADKFCEIIKRRFEQNRPTVITSRDSIKELTTNGLLPRSIVDKLMNKMVSIHLTDNQRRATQSKIEF